MKRLILLYVAAWVLPLALYVYEWKFGGCGVSAGQISIADYVLYLSATVVTLLVSYVTVKFFAFRRVKDKLAGKEGSSYANYLSLSALRLCLVLFAEVFNILVLLVAKERSVLYLMAILVIVLFFCIPASSQGKESSLPPSKE
jgi:L-asparagine transporter-like permease